MATSSGANQSVSTLRDRVIALSCINCVLKHQLTPEEYGVSLLSECSCICHTSVDDRLVIFSSGTDTYIPHQIGFKLVQADLVLFIVVLQFITIVFVIRC